MNNPDNLKYTKEHEWILLEQKTATIGITDYAQSQLGDIVFVELPDLDDEVKQDGTFGVIEAVKTVADLFAPVSGKVIEINLDLEDSPDLINSDPYGAGWIIKTQIENNDEIAALMSSSEYQEYIK
ncbi:MAG: glycine cleavage system protein GcvH [Candidatus Neomarinimicrobiota bacterium]|nr:glycine cleavage system protein H [Candidatus Neomarinimicrobiota bacterium]MEC7854967.1 glycine cleavage system protein GcvH [Candidatus Neomarinimicrobiota bacterium]MEC7981007.1 glycine cleavage system protein GcvH [Candidatus Neomarinimicrobiota bacterium]MEC8689320.1 glycine cleavage system protein GcvH [Candidatus Neomarinimicrobiota bacterium]|tara:strand:+ start:193 stop:570 length:378 start_codon:yes stop_codon:yes gene_type:complete